VSSLTSPLSYAARGGEKGYRHRNRNSRKTRAGGGGGQADLQEVLTMCERVAAAKIHFQSVPTG